MVLTTTRSTFSSVAATAFGCSLLFGTAPASAQTDTSTLNVTAYADAYYAAYTGDYTPGDPVEFETMSSRANALGLNAIGVAVAYEADRIRANGEIFFGDVQQFAWTETPNTGYPNVIKNANAGVRVAEDFWIDAGFFSTYAGVESALPKDNVFSSVAVSTYQEPYFHAAVKASYTGVEGLDLELWLMNAYNGYYENNKAKTLGAVVRYAFNDDATLSYTGTFGREDDQPAPGSTIELNDTPYRLYNNVNFVATPTEQLEVIVNASLRTDTKMGENSDESISSANGMATVRYSVSERFAVAARGAFLADNDGQLYDAGGDVNDFGLSLQLIPADNSYVRLEGRTIGSESDIFSDNDGDAADRRFDLVLSMGVSLGRDWSFAKR